MNATYSRWLAQLWPLRCGACDAGYLPGPNQQPLLCSACEISLVTAQRAELAVLGARLAITPFAYGGQLAVALRRFKYAGQSILAPRIAALTHAALTDQHWPQAVDAVAAVPLHRRRLRQRGYNQAGLLARQLARLLDLPFRPHLLQRTHDTPPQASRDRHQRWQLAPTTFRARPLRRARILLIDDVITTGATLTSCLRALRHAGAASIDILTVARTLL